MFGLSVGLQMKSFIMSSKIPGDWPRTYPGLLERSSPLLASPSIFLPDQVLQHIAMSEGSTDFQKLALWIVNDVNAAVNKAANSKGEDLSCHTCSWAISF